MSEDNSWHNAACHCGAVQFRLRLPDGFSSIRRCTCSYCRMRGAIAVSALLDDLEITQGQENLSLYRFNTGAAQHYFCKICGIYTHHQRRSNPHQFGVNLACIEGCSPFDFAEVQVLDGITHPEDNGGKLRVAGILRYSPEV